MRSLVLGLLFSLLPLAAFAGKFALVIGNADYRHVSPLDNPGNDARAVGTALRKQGFEVITAIDLTRSQLYNTLRDFRDKADQASVAMVYYAGHGIEVGGQNYLIPVDARLADERDADIEMIEMDVVLRQLSGAKSLKMVVLDACRDNPFAQKMKRSSQGRSVGRGLSVVSSAEAATLIAYAAAAGEVTPDGVGRENSPFTTAFLNALDKPPADVRILLGAVRDELSQTVPGAVPFVYSSLGEQQIVINPNSERAPKPKPEPEPAESAASENGGFDEDAMLRDFAKAEFVDTREAWDDFLETYKSFDTHMLYVIARRSKMQIVKPRPASVESAAAPEPAAVEVQPVSALPLDVAAREVQSLLKDRNCYPGRIDGIFGRGSLSALGRLETRLGKRFDIPRNPDAGEMNNLLTDLRNAGPGKCAVQARANPVPAQPAARAPQPAPVQQQAATEQVDQPAAAPEPAKPKCRKASDPFSDTGASGILIGLPLCRKGQ